MRADHSTIRRPMSSTVSPTLAWMSLTLPCGRNRAGTPISRVGDIDVGRPKRLRDPGPDPAVDDAVLDRDDQPGLPGQLEQRRVDRGDPPRVDDPDGEAGAAHRADRFEDSRSPSPRPRPRARRPGVGVGLGQHIDAADRGGRPGCRRRAAFSGTAATVGPSAWATASRSSARSVGSSRGAAIRMPGTMPSSARSHMPLWLAPSSPVRPARSRTTVTGRRCSATSIISWSNARLRKVAYSATTGCMPPEARPAAEVIACCSAMPTS